MNTATRETNLTVYAGNVNGREVFYVRHRNGEFEAGPFESREQTLEEIVRLNASGKYTRTAEQVHMELDAALIEVNLYESGETEANGQWERYEALFDEYYKLAAKKTAWLDSEEIEMQNAWNAFADPVQENHGECLQYMGSEYNDGKWQHCFRHRCDPITGQRKYTRIDASPSWNPVQTRAA